MFHFREYYENYGPIDWPRRIEIATDIVRGLTFLHEVSILHHDIRSQNILINRYHAAKIANFTLSRNYTDITSAMAPTLETVRYLAPEKLSDHRKNPYTTKCEIFSFGILLWEIAEEQIPYNEKTDIVEIRETVLNSKSLPFSLNVPLDWQKISLEAIHDTDDDDDLVIDLDITELSTVLSVEDAIQEYKKKDGDKIIAFNAFQKHASFGDLYAKYWVEYYLYYNINGNPSQNKKAQMEKAAEYFKEAADKGQIPEAQLRYGHCLWAGDGVQRSIESAINYFQLAAHNNNITAMYNIGNIYYKGFGIPKDEKKGKRYLILAALKGQPKALDMCRKENILLTENLD
ncbi:hypothetical protein G9A89_023438 [Geosiphon pyriformis]|nr:hypothetical protein G9A89_023438 [Geosiphon pyriformis]